MQLNILMILLLVCAYIMGSVLNAVWVSKVFYGFDVRDFGSKNAGSTNTVRILGWKAGIPVFILDAFKGFAAVNLVRIYSYYAPGTNYFVTFQLLLGAFAVIGHIFPVFYKFKGGKGVASLFGIVLAISLWPTLITLGIFVITLLITRYVSLSSMIAGIVFPLLIMFVFPTSIQSLIIFSLIISILLLLTHQKNIQRLINREESKANFLFRKKKDSI